VAKVWQSVAKQGKSVVKCGKSVAIGVDDLCHNVYNCASGKVEGEKFY